LNYTLSFMGSPGFVGLYVAREWTMSLYYNNNACGNLQHIHSIARTHTILLYVWIVFPSSCTSYCETHVKSFYSYPLIFLAHPCKGQCTSYIYATVHFKKNHPMTFKEEDNIWHCYLKPHSCSFIIITLKGRLVSYRFWKVHCPYSTIEVTSRQI
jgi:hypothetical protein